VIGAMVSDNFLANFTAVIHGNSKRVCLGAVVATQRTVPSGARVRLQDSCLVGQYLLIGRSIGIGLVHFDELAAQPNSSVQSLSKGSLQPRRIFGVGADRLEANWLSGAIGINGKVRVVARIGNRIE
jgi:hypothetical protein